MYLVFSELVGTKFGKISERENISNILGWMKHKLESRMSGEISVTSDMQITPPLWQKVKKN